MSDDVVEETHAMHDRRENGCTEVARNREDCYGCWGRDVVLTQEKNVNSPALPDATGQRGGGISMRPRHSRIDSFSQVLQHAAGGVLSCYVPPSISGSNVPPEAGSREGAALY